MTDATKTDYMGKLNGNTPISHLSLAGTHDTMTSSCADRYYRTQSLTLPEQLEIGVRFVDIRLTKLMVAAHREWISDISFQEILDVLQLFLDRHRSEVIIMRVQNANEKKDDYPEYATALKSCIDRNMEMFWQPTSADNPRQWPQLDQVRSKIIALECSPPELGVNRLEGKAWAIPWHRNLSIRIQDLWDGPDPAEKIAAITRTLNPAPKQHNDLIINHVSATNGVLGDPLAYAQVLNPQVARLLAKNRSRGVVIYDFIDPTLAALTIKAGHI